MKSFDSENLTTAESARRYVLTAIILAFFFANPGIPAWVALLSVYPFATAMLKWDPLNAVFENMASKYDAKKVAAGNLQNAI